MCSNKDNHAKEINFFKTDKVIHRSLVSKWEGASPRFQQAKKTPSQSHGSQTPPQQSCWGSNYLHHDFQGWSHLELQAQDPSKGHSKDKANTETSTGATLSKRGGERPASSLNSKPVEPQEHYSCLRAMLRGWLSKAMDAGTLVCQ